MRDKGKPLIPEDSSLEDRAYDLFGEILLQRETAALLTEIETEKARGDTAEMDAFFAKQDVKNLEKIQRHANQPAEGSAEESALDLGTRLLRVTPGQPLMRGSDVLAVQTRLLAKGFAPGKLDGVYGNITKAAVVALQTACGIMADGVVGPDTRVILR